MFDKGHKGSGCKSVSFYAYVELFNVVVINRNDQKTLIRTNILNKEPQVIEENTKGSLSMFRQKDS